MKGSLKFGDHVSYGKIRLIFIRRYNNDWIAIGDDGWQFRGHKAALTKGWPTPREAAAHKRYITRLRKQYEH